MNRILHSRFHNFVIREQKDNDGLARLPTLKGRGNRCFFLIIIDIILLLTVAGCSSVGDVITQNPRKYVYKAEEQINFYDNVQTGECISTLTFFSMLTLCDSPFTVREASGTDEKGDVIYTDVVYEQLIQINYSFQQYTDKYTDDIVQKFRVADTKGDWGIKNPSVEYTKMAVSGMDSFVVALKNKSDNIKISVYYSGFFTPNAIVQLTKDNASTMVPSVDAADSSSNDSLSDLKAQLEEKNRLIYQQNEINNHLRMMISILGSFLIIELVVILILIFKRKNNFFT